MNKLSEDTKKSDAIILDKLKNSLKFKTENKEKVMILEHNKLDELCNIIEKRKLYIYSLFNDSFSIKEQEIKEELFCKKCSRKTNLNRLADGLLNRRINAIFENIINDESLSSWTRIVAIDRKVFINFLLENPTELNSPQSSIKTSSGELNLVQIPNKLTIPQAKSDFQHEDR